MNALSLFQAPPPDMTVEIAPGYVTAAHVAGPGASGVVAQAVVPLEPGVVVPALNATNVVRPQAVSDALARAFAALGRRPRRIAVAVPDALAKVSFVRFASVPARTADLEAMIRFQVRKAAPFRIEDAAVTYAAGASQDGQREFVVCQARRDLVAEYEAACAAAGAQAGIVELSTFCVINATLAFPAGEDGDSLVIHAHADGASLGILRGAHLVYFRHRGAEGEGTIEELVHQTAMYYQDRLGGEGFARAWLAGTLPGGEGARHGIEERLGVRLAPVSMRALTSGGADLPPALVPAAGLAASMRRPPRD